MKTKLMMLLAGWMVLGLFSGTALAQGGTEPPPCCPKEDPPPPSPPPDDSGFVITTDPLTGTTQVTVSDAALLSLGLTRSEVLGRIAAGLFPGQDPSVVIPVLSLSAATDPADGSSLATADGTLLIVQVPLSGLDPLALDSVDLLFLTDGTAGIQIVFVRDVSTTIS